MNWWWSSVSCSRLSASLGGGSMTSLLITQHCSRSLMMHSSDAPAPCAMRIIHCTPAQKPIRGRCGEGASALDGAADVPGAEHELLHLDRASDAGEILPRLDQRIAKHRALHEPKTERQNEPPAEAGRQLGVHDDQ